MADDNLKIQLEINKVFRERSILIEKINEQLDSQVDIATRLKDFFGDIKIPTDARTRINEIKQSLMEAAEEAEALNDTQQELLESLKEGIDESNESFEGFIERIKESTKETSVFATGTTAFLDGMLTSIKGLKGSLGGLIDLAFAAANGLFQIGKAILAIPFKMFNALVEEANRFQGGTELMQAFEDIRKFSGDFKADISKNIIKSARSMRGELANTGLSVFRTAGMLWERLNLLRETAEEMAERFEVVGSEFRENAEVMIAYKKALGLTGEALSGFTAIAVKTNKSLNETLRNVATFSTGLGEQFGLSQKTIARDVGEMVKDLKNFGSVGVRQMAQLSVFSRKLGVAFKELLGIVDKFDNFQDAAENAARLSQAFGVNIDVMKQMNEQDPAKRVENMRQAFFNAGKSVERMTRQERAYLVQTTGIEDSAIDQVFALKNQRISYDEMSRSGAIAEKQQLTTAEAMSKLAASIERIVRSGQRQGGFWDRFVLGLTIGARRAMAHDRVWRNIRRSLWQAEFAGRAVGRMFIRLFPGMNQISKGFAAFFHPSKFKALRTGVVGAFRQLFKELGDPTKAKKALENFFTNLKKAFEKMGSKEKNPVNMIINGFKKAFKAVGQVFLSATRLVIENITKFIKAITMVIKGDISFSDALKEVFNNGVEQGTSVLGDVVAAIKEQVGPASSELWGALKEFFSLAWEKTSTFIGAKVSEWWNNFSIGNFIKENPKTSMAIAAYLFGPAFLKAGLAMAGHALLKILAGGSATAFKGAAGGFTAGLKSLFMGGAVVAISAFTAYMLIELGKVMSEFNDHINELSNQTKNISKIHDLRKKTAEEQLSQVGVYKKELDELYSLEGTALGSKIKQLSKINDLSTQNIEQLKIAAKTEAKKRLDEMSAQETLALATNSYDKYGNRVSGEENYEMLVKAHADEKAKLNKKIMSIDKQFDDALFESRVKAAHEQMLETARQAKELAQSGKINTVDDLSEVLNNTKKFSAKEIQKAEKTFSIAKDIITRPGGIKDKMSEIVVAFKDFDSSGFQGVSNTIDNISVIPRTLAEASKDFKEISKTDLTKLIDMSISNINKALEKGDFSLTTQSITNLGAMSIQKPIIEKSLGDIISLVSTFNELKSEANDLLGEKKSFPVVKIIESMVKIVNTINDDLSKINGINLKPKLKNLGKVLGYGGTDTYTINNKNFKLDVNVNVHMDTKELAKILIETGQFATTKSGK